MVQSDYVKILTEIKPKPIRSEVEKKHFLGLLNDLMSIDEDKLTEEQANLLELLALLIEDYEKKNYQIPQQATPNDILKELMECNGLQQKDLLDIFGSKGIISEVINNKRSISKQQAKALGRRFNVSPALFI